DFLKVEDSSGTASLSDTNSDTVTVTFNTGCGGTTTTFPAYPGVTYKSVSPLGGSLGASVSGVVSTGTMQANGPTTFTATRGNVAPTALIDGPYVGGVLTTNPALSSSVTLNDISYDSDNGGGTTALTGICSASWLVTRPDGMTFSSTGGGALYSVNFT